MTIYILGAGPTGIACIHEIVKKANARFVCIERGARGGGLSQTIGWGDHGSHDLGPHKIFSIDNSLMAKVESILPSEEWLTHPKKSKIFMGGNFIPYPPTPFSLIKNYGYGFFLRAAIDFGMAKLSAPFKKKKSANFEEDLLKRVGRRLYETLFKPIAMKLWDDPKNLDSTLSRGRVQIPSLRELAAKIVNLRASKSFEALYFKYPGGGLQKIWDAVLSISEGMGECLFDTEVTDLTVEDRAIRTICCRNICNGESRTFSLGRDDFVFSTIPLAELPKIMKNSMQQAVSEDIKKLTRLNDLLLVFLKLDRERLTNESWIFVPDPEVIFHRLSEQAVFDQGMVRGGSIVCCEIMSSRIRPTIGYSDKELVTQTLEGLKKMRYEDFSVVDSKVVRLPLSYPVYSCGFKMVLENVLAELDSIVNFRTIGRQGSFNYIGTLDAMDIGYGAVQCFLRSVGTETVDKSWQMERLRTSEYPVFD